MNPTDDETGDLSDELLKKLSNLACLDSDYDCRSEAVNAFLNLMEADDSDWQDPARKEKYRRHAKAMVKDHFTEGIRDDNWKVRQSWIKLVKAHAIDGEPSHLVKSDYTSSYSSVT